MGSTQQYCRDLQPREAPSAMAGFRFSAKGLSRFNSKSAGVGKSQGSRHGHRMNASKPQPFGFHASTQRSRAGCPRLRRKSGHTSFSPWTSEPPKPSGSASSDLIFARNAIRPSSVNRP
jgi:hypothetical protein